jgi:hypothetical protein
MQASPERAVGDLIMILEKVHEAVRGNVSHGCATRLLLPRVVLPLKKEAVLRGGYELLRRGVVIAVVPLTMSGQRNDSAVVEIIIPLRVQAAFRQKFDLLSLVLGGDIGRATT